MSMGGETVYEVVQNFNRVTRFLHAGRYKELLKTVAALQEEARGRRIQVLDIGCGPGSAVGPLVENFDVDYTGIDYDPTFIEAALKKHGHRENCRFIVADASDRNIYESLSADIVIALETFEHIPANRVVRVIEHVCEIVKPKVFLITVPVEVGPAVWIKNWGAALMGYNRQSGNIRETFWAGLYQLDKVPPHGVSHQGFDWRWVAQTMRMNAPIKEIRSLPFSFIPRFFAPNVVIVSEPLKPLAGRNPGLSHSWKVNHKAVKMIFVGLALALEMALQSTQADA